MLKKSLIAVLFSLVMAMVLGTNVFAAEGIEQEANQELTPEISAALDSIELINKNIYVEIGDVQEKSLALFTAYESSVKNVESISEKNKLYSAYNKEINAMINELKATTREMTKDGMKIAREAGINTRPELIRVEFTDRFAMIDPIVVVSW